MLVVPTLGTLLKSPCRYGFGTNLSDTTLDIFKYRQQKEPFRGQMIRGQAETKIFVVMKVPVLEEVISLGANPDFQTTS